MTSLTYLIKRKKKASSSLDWDLKFSPNGKLTSNKDLLKGDLFCHLTYMSAIATSRLPRHLLFEYSGSVPYYSSRYIAKINYLTKKLNYDYPEACRIVGEETKEPEPKAILLRMSGALSSGEDEADFLKREAYAIGETYGDDYERSVESLKKWTDAYVALILSASLVVVISVVSMLIFPMPAASIATLTWLMLMATLFGAWIMYRASPKDIKTHSLPYKSPAQAMASTMLRFFVIPLALIAVLFLLVLKASLGLSMVVMGIILLPVGCVIMWDDRRVDKLDNDIAGFLRSLGGITKAIGTTVTEGIGRIDFGSLGALKKPVIILHRSLQIGIKPDLCWQRFVGGTGSEHINRSIQIFWDGIALGGDPLLVGTQASMFAMKVNLLRAKRRLVSSNFSYTCLLIHGTIALLLVGIYQVLVNFSTLLQNMEGLNGSASEGLMNLPTFQFFMDSSTQLNTLNMMVTAMLLMLTIVNAMGIKVVEGGHNWKLLFYLGATSIISGLSLICVPGLLKGIFSVVGG